MISRTCSSAASASCTNGPQLDRSAGISASSSQRPLTWPKRSSWGRMSGFMPSRASSRMLTPPDPNRPAVPPPCGTVGSMTEQTIDAVRVVATIPTKPDAAEAVRAGLAELAHATRGEEGCLAYDVFESQAGHVFVTIEAWRHPRPRRPHGHPARRGGFALLGMP